MKKLIFALLCAVVTIGASAQDGKLTVNAGFLFPLHAQRDCRL